MRSCLATVGLAMTALAQAQVVDNVYDRDTHDQFKLRGLKVYSMVIGPIVRTGAL